MKNLQEAFIAAETWLVNEMLTVCVCLKETPAWCLWGPWGPQATF